jgi:hypothetical protein
MRRGLAALLLLVAALVQFLCLGTPASAQYLDMKLGEPLPDLFFRVCKDTQSARKQSENATYRAEFREDQVSLKDLLIPGGDCIEGNFAIVTPIREELTIPRGRGWNPIFDGKGKWKCDRLLRINPTQPESIVRIPCVWVVQEFRFYYVKFELANGRTYHGYAEIFPTSITFQYLTHLAQQGASP